MKRMLLGAVMLTACAQADVDFKQARFLEKAGQFFRAAQAYEDFIDKHPRDPRIGEASFKTGRIYSDALRTCERAAPHYERAARSGKPPWAGRAKVALIVCPDFFPTKVGFKWTYVDTLSGGENMQLAISVRRSSGPAHGVVEGAMYAGELKIRDYGRTVTKEDWTIFETVGDEKVPILKYPFTKGHRWEMRRGGKQIQFEITAHGLTVDTLAGKFLDCVKVREHTEGYESWVFDYYCPGVGRVKKTVGVPGVENPNTELSRYTAPKA